MKGTGILVKKTSEGSWKRIEKRYNKKKGKPRTGLGGLAVEDSCLWSLYLRNPSRVHTHGGRRSYQGDEGILKKEVRNI